MADLNPDERRRLARLAAVPPLVAVLEAVADHGPYLAGGSVRDALLGRASADLDLSLSGAPEQVAPAAARVGRLLGARPHLLGRPPRAVWRVDGDTVKVELWPLGALSPEADAGRRDLTVNAMLWRPPDGPLVDPTGGLADLRSTTLRATSRAALADDPVRLLRAARFLSALAGFRLDPRTSEWIRELAPTLAGAPRERVGRELLLLVAGPLPERGARALLELGLLEPSAPPGCSPDPGWLRAHIGALERLASPRLHPVPSAVRDAGAAAPVALLLRALGADDEGAAAGYSWDRGLRGAAFAATRELGAMARAAAGPVADRRELIFRLGGAFPVALSAAAACRRPGSADHWRRWWRLWRRRGSELVEPRLVLGAEEVRELAGPVSGPELGRLLRAVERAQVRGEIRSAGAARGLVLRLAGR